MANPKFKIGDKVKTHSGRGTNIGYVNEMDDYCGKSAKIVSDRNYSGEIFYRLENIPFNWHESLLEKVKG